MCLKQMTCCQPENKIISIKIIFTGFVFCFKKISELFFLLQCAWHSLMSQKPSVKRNKSCIYWCFSFQTSKMLPCSPLQNTLLSIEGPTWVLQIQLPYQLICHLDVYCTVRIWTSKHLITTLPNCLHNADKLAVSFRKKVSYNFAIDSWFLITKFIMVVFNSLW